MSLIWFENMRHCKNMILLGQLMLESGFISTLNVSPYI